MLQDLFLRDQRRYEGSRFGAELETLSGWLATHGHLRHPLRLHLHRVGKVRDGCDRFHPGGMFKEEDLRQAFIVSGPGAYECRCTGRIFTRFLAAAGRLVPVERTDALSLLRCRYHHFLAEVRGLLQQLPEQHGTTVADFLSRGLPPDHALSGLTAADVETFVQTKSQENKRESLQHVVGQLRALLRYCGDHSEAPGGLDVIDTPRVYRGELPP
jgi:integrase/recombinase XerD